MTNIVRFTLSIFVVFFLSVLAVNLPLLIPPTIELLPKKIEQAYLRFYVYYLRETANQHAEWDQSTFYRLPKNVEFQINNPEYVMGVTTNRLGVRDREDNLIKPEVIFLGDSQTMGTGVQENDRFSNIFARKTGLKSLNLGISSYAQAREIELLKEVDLSNLKYLFVQYSPNDYPENRWVYNKLRQGIEYRSIPKPNEDQFKSNQEKSLELSSRYKNPVYVYAKVLSLIVHSYLNEEEEIQTIEFLRYLNERSHAVSFAKFLPYLLKLTNARIIVFGVRDNTYDKKLENFDEFTTHKFKQHLRWVLQNNNENQFGDVSVISFSDIEEEDYFILDGHLRESGHKKIASALIESLTKVVQQDDMNFKEYSTENSERIDKVESPLPPQAFRGDISCDVARPLKFKGDAASSFTVFVRNDSDYLWPGEDVFSELPINIRSKVLDDKKQIVSSDPPTARVPLKRSLIPGQTVAIDIPVDPSKLELDSGYLSVNLVQEHNRWLFNGVGEYQGKCTQRFFKE